MLPSEVRCQLCRVTQELQTAGLMPFHATHPKWAKCGNMGRDLLAFIVAAFAPDTPASPLRHENR